MAIVLTPDKKVLQALIAESETLFGETPEAVRVPPGDQRGLLLSPDEASSLLSSSAALAAAMPEHHRKKLRLAPVITCAEYASEYFELRSLLTDGHLPGRILGREDMAISGAAGGPPTSLYGRIRWLRRYRRMLRPAQRGAALLDTREPRWWDLVDDTELKEPGGVLKQLYGREAALEVAFTFCPDAESVLRLGFGAEPEDRVALALRWEREVRLRSKASPNKAIEEDVRSSVSPEQKAHGDSRPAPQEPTPWESGERKRPAKRQRKKPEVRPAKRDPDPPAGEDNDKEMREYTDSGGQ